MVVVHLPETGYFHLHLFRWLVYQSSIKESPLYSHASDLYAFQQVRAQNKLGKIIFNTHSMDSFYRSHLGLNSGDRCLKKKSAINLLHQFPEQIHSFFVWLMGLMASAMNVTPYAHLRMRHLQYRILKKFRPSVNSTHRILIVPRRIYLSLLWWTHYNLKASWIHKPTNLTVVCVGLFLLPE